MIGLFLILACCDKPVSVRQMYYPIDSLLDNQIQLLRKENARVEKIASIGSEKSKHSFTPDSVQWIKELDVFRQIEIINKPVNAGNYRVVEQKDKKSNLTIRSFEAANDDLSIQVFRIYYLNTPAKLKQIEAHYIERNAMYTGRRFLSMRFHDITGSPYLSEYAIKGGHKMLFGDTVEYAVTCKVSVIKD
jgi:hypothetical protein